MPEALSKKSAPSEKLEFVLNAEWAEFARLNPGSAAVQEFAKDLTGQEFMRVRGKPGVYKIKTENEKGEQTYVCVKCGGDVMGATVAHAIWDGPFPMSGSGRCHYEQVPYCPRCEQEPTNGMPIRVGAGARG